MTSLKLYNALSKEVVEFQPIGKTVGIYSCGPTAYDYMHIGNLLAFIYADTIRRVVELSGNKTKHVMNITDIDDKTVKKSSEKYPNIEPKLALKRLTDEYTALILRDMEFANIQVKKMTIIDATDYIEQMKALIIKLLDAGYAYTADDGIYFSISKYVESGHIYGQLSKITASSTSQSRIDNDEYDKETAHDFALWKKHKSGEPSWDFDVSGQDFSGRPGWHIECSVMSTEILGQPFDIHTGGIDHLFPHHENEIAQSTALFSDKPLAHWFTHNGHLSVNGKKMSKSLGNYYTLSDVTDKGYSALDFRYLALQSHYRSSANFTWESIEAAKNTMAKLNTMADMRFQLLETDTYIDFKKYTDDITAHLLNDIDTPNSLAVLHKSSDEILSGVGKNQEHEFIEYLKFCDDIFGFNFNQRTNLNNTQLELLKNRLEARNSKDWVKSDSIRDDLKQQGILVQDSTSSLKQIWTKIN